MIKLGNGIMWIGAYLLIVSMLFALGCSQGSAQSPTGASTQDDRRITPTEAGNAPETATDSDSDRKDWRELIEIAKTPLPPTPTPVPPPTPTAKQIREQAEREAALQREQAEREAENERMLDKWNAYYAYVNPMQEEFTEFASTCYSHPSGYDRPCLEKAWNICVVMMQEIEEHPMFTEQMGFGGTNLEDADLDDDEWFEVCKTSVNDSSTLPLLHIGHYRHLLRE